MTWVFLFTQGLAADDEVAKQKKAKPQTFYPDSSTPDAPSPPSAAQGGPVCTTGEPPPLVGQKNVQILLCVVVPLACCTVQFLPILWRCLRSLLLLPCIYEPPLLGLGCYVGKHPVSALNELCTRKKWSIQYELVMTSGPPHSRSFKYQVANAHAHAPMHAPTHTDPPTPPHTHTPMHPCMHPRTHTHTHPPPHTHFTVWYSEVTKSRSHNADEVPILFVKRKRRTMIHHVTSELHAIPYSWKFWQEDILAVC